MWIHRSHQPQAHRALVAIGVSLIVLLIISSVSVSESLKGTANNLPTHMALESLAIVVAALIFGLIWSARSEPLPRNLIVLAVAFLGVGLLDFSHMLSYQGMPDYFTPGSPDKSIAFWLAARLLGALALLAVAWLPWQTVRSPSGAWLLLTSTLILTLAFHVVVFRYPRLLPAFFVVGQGLTSFKIVFEYALIALNLLAATLFFLRMRTPRRFNASGLFVAACLMAQGEFFLTLYTQITDLYSLAGHLYKALAYVYLYWAVFVETVQRPYALMHASKQSLQATLNALPDLAFEMDRQGRYLAVYTPDRPNLSWPSDELQGQLAHNIMPEHESNTILAALDEAHREGISYGKLITLPVVKQDQLHSFELSVARKAPRPGETERFVVISRDVTERLKSEQVRRTLMQAVQQSPIGFVITDAQHRIELANQAYADLHRSTIEELLGSAPFDVLLQDNPSSTLDALKRRLAEGKPWQGELIRRRRGGQKVTAATMIFPVRNAAGEIVNHLAHLEDVTEKKQSEARIQQLSYYDQLTGLPNQALLQEHFHYARARAQSLAVLWINLDHFKDVNDSLGHHVGDMLLLEIARRLRTTLRARDILSRYTSDDFVAILPSLTQTEVANQTRALLEAISLPVELSGQDISISASIGIALCPDDAEQFEPLFKHAETAMYRAKDDGRNRCCFFTPEMQEQASHLLALGGTLKQAQQRGELRLVYQPQLRLSDGQIIGAEALLRWDSPQWGVVEPSTFIPIAESTGLILPIGDWVLQTAVSQIRNWLDRGLPEITVYVNLSALQFDQPDLPDRISQILADAQVPPKCLALELTEAVAMRSPDIAAQKMHALNKLGIRLAIDDFGTGYSSLIYLKQFKIQKLKIDQSFVRDINRDPTDQAIATAIIQMACSLGIGVIAEGVETAEQLKILQTCGCNDIQGYYFSRPLPPDEFEAFIRDR